MISLKFVLHKYVFASVLVLAALSGCGGGGGSATPASGNSDVGAPDSIIANTLIETVTASGYTPSTPGATINITQPGGTLTYSFVDANTIMGVGVNVIPTLS